MFRSFLQSFWLTLILVLRQFSPNALAFGNGYSSGCFAMKCLSISAVLDFSLYVPFACPFVPFTLIVPCSVFIWLLGVWCISSGSMAVSLIMVKIAAMLGEAVFIIACTCSFVGISGIGGS